MQITYTKKEFRWLITTIFDDCEYFTLVDKEQEHKASQTLMEQQQATQTA